MLRILLRFLLGMGKSCLRPATGDILKRQPRKACCIVVVVIIAFPSLFLRLDRIHYFLKKDKNSARRKFKSPVEPVRPPAVRTPFETFI